MNRKTGKWSVLNLILLNRIKRKITGKKNWLLTPADIDNRNATNNDSMGKNSGPGILYWLRQRRLPLVQFC